MDASPVTEFDFLANAQRQRAEYPSIRQLLNGAVPTPMPRVVQHGIDGDWYNSPWIDLGVDADGFGVFFIPNGI